MPSELPASFPIVSSESADALAQYLRINPPNGVAREHPPLESERSPILLSFLRHRRVPLPWDALVPSERRAGATELGSLRSAIERSWGVVPAPPPNPATIANFVSRSTNANSYAAWWFVGAKPGSLLTFDARREDVPDGSVILREGPSDGDVFFWAKPRGAAVLDFANAYETAWSNVDTLVRVFKSASPPPDAIDPRSLLADDAKDFLDVPIRTDGFVLRPPGIPLSGGSNLTLPQIVSPRGSYTVTPEQIRGELEDGWGLTRIPAAVLAQHVKRVSEVGALVRLDVEALRSKAAHDGSILAQVKAEPQATAALGPTEWVLENHGRFFHVQFRAGIDPGGIDLRDPARYRLAWTADIVGLELAGIAGALPFAHYQSVDLRPQAIVDELTRLDADRVVAGSFNTLSDALLKKLETMTDNDLSEIDAVADKCRTLKLRTPAVEEKRQILSERAARLGYELPLKDTTIPTANPALTKPIFEGHLYRRFINFGSYTKTVQVPTDIQIFGLTIRTFHTETYVIYSFFLDAIEVQPDHEPVVDAVNELTAAGFTCCRMTLSDEGYIGEDGVLLTEIMRRAEFDEAFRRTLALFIPVYQQRLTDGMIIVRYDIFIRPLPGFAASRFPTLYLEENLSYRTEWRGVEIGELLHSVSLAPGEERTVSITRSVKQTTERVDSIVSILDVTQTQKLDLSDAMEATTRRENTTTSSSNWNVKAGAAWGPFSAEGGGGGSTTTTSKDFAENVRKQAMQASRELRVNQRQEVRSSTTATTAIASEESTSSRIANINQGRTMNLLFHELTNVFEGGVFLDDIKFVYTPSVPVIAGTQLANPMTVTLRDLPQLIDAIADDDVFFTTFGVDRETVQRAAVRQILQTVLTEYVDDDGTGSSTPDAPPVMKGIAAADVSSPIAKRSVNALRFDVPLDREQNAWLYGAPTSPMAVPPAGKAAPAPAPPAPPREASVGDEIAAAMSVLRRLTRTNEPLVPHLLTTPAAATYLDVALGVVPATEPYSEEMRARELAVRTAEALDRTGDAELKHARAITLLRSGGEDAMYPLKQPVITDAKIDNGRLKVAFSGPLPEGTWDAIINDGPRVALPPLAQAVSIAVTLDKGIVSDGKLQHLQIVERLLGIYVEYPA